MKIKSAAFCKKLETELSERKRRTRRIESSRLQEVYSTLRLSHSTWADSL